MSQVNLLLSQRMGKIEKSPKMAALARRSANGDLNGFAGIFAVAKLSGQETEALERILASYATVEVDVQKDLEALISITSEVKAINNQAALLHGERIKRVQSLLLAYKEGAFTSWLVATYGNRQTPYNLLQYYEFYQSLPKDLRPQLELMPRQAVYTLASREGQLDAKQRIVKNYAGEGKHEMLAVIRRLFPLHPSDRRSEKPGVTALKTLQKVYDLLEGNQRCLTPGQKRRCHDLLDDIRSLL